MSSITGALDGLHAAVDAFDVADFDALGAGELLKALDSLETACRRAVAVCHSGAAALARHDKESLKSAPHALLADMLRITPAAARRRLRDAAQLGGRTSLTGQPLPPELPATGAAWEAGTLDPEHLRTIQAFMAELPDHLPAAEVERAEAFLAEKAAELRPDQLRRVADRLVSGTPSQDVVDRDARGTSQRQHDALSALVRGQLGDPKLGQHNGVPVTLIVSATLEQLQSGAGYAVTCDPRGFTRVALPVRV